jgi:choline kinase
MKATLVIMAAGMASLYGSMKQIQAFGPSGETIMDYSIYDAIKAGFGKIVFIIRKDFAEEFKAIFEPKLKGRIALEYVYQDLRSFMEGYEIPADRTKPWGTAHAVLCTKDVVKEPFVVINADDFYGRDAFEKGVGFLEHDAKDNVSAIIGYELQKTLSDHGSVSRGVCQQDANGNLVKFQELTKIYEENGKIVSEAADGSKTELAPTTPVSMNFWCFLPSVFPFFETVFRGFVDKNLHNPKSEIYIGNAAIEYIHEPGNLIKIVPTGAKWFGVTYREDAPGVKKSIEELVKNGQYPTSLWS